MSSTAWTSPRTSWPVQRTLRAVGSPFGPGWAGSGTISSTSGPRTVKRMVIVWSGPPRTEIVSARLSSAFQASPSRYWPGASGFRVSV
jgi:hypothetical protein